MMNFVEFCKRFHSEQMDQLDEDNWNWCYSSCIPVHKIGSWERQGQRQRVRGWQT